jgi:hypothetical protein
MVPIPGTKRNPKWQKVKTNTPVAEGVWFAGKVMNPTSN